MGNGAAWLGMVREDESWSLPVGAGVTSGANALFGGCATAAALVAAREVAPQPLVWASAHFGVLAKADTSVRLTSRAISSGRTMTHLEVVGTVDDREAFVVRMAAGERPAHPVQGQWRAAPAVVAVADAAPFDHPVHEGTWAARFEWRLAGTGDADASGPWAAWWVRPRADDPCEPLVAAAVLADYVTYGVGRALGEPMGGLSVDNVLRLGDVAEGPASTDGGWLLLEVRPDVVEGGFGHGTARLFGADGRLVATGSQSMVVNTWDWRLPSER
jgi:acyl-CoA thioesterase